MTVRTIVTDIEGTTSSINFVTRVLFPYASDALPEFVRQHADDDAIAGILNDARDEASEPDADTERLIAIMLQWISEDRKVTALKALQGHIWRGGYEAGEFTGHIYDDAVENLRQWSERSIDLYVYSSGSVAAQKLLFGYSGAGDLRPLFRGWFDTRIGHKRDADSYRSIVQELATPAEEILFLSDVVEELDAARMAGMRTTQLVRDPDMLTGDHTLAHDFDEVVI